MEIKPLNLNLSKELQTHIEFMEFLRVKFMEVTLSELRVPGAYHNTKYNYKDESKNS